jgi:hypothetical protein
LDGTTPFRSTKHRAICFTIAIRSLRTWRLPSPA